MVQDSPSPQDNPKDEPDILDLQAEKTAVEKPAGRAESAAESRSASASDGERTASAARAESASSASQSAPYGKPQPRPASGHGTSSLIAAGILGGLIALSAAASMQYAGYWPGTSAAQPVKTDTADIAALKAEIDSLSQKLASVPAAPTLSPDLEKRLAALETAAEAKASAIEDSPALKVLQETLGQLKAVADTAAQQADAKLAELGTRLAAAEKTLKDQPGEAAVSRAIAATYLKAAVDRGAPFLTELQTFASLAPDDPAIEGLKPLAAAGVPSRSDLLKGFDAAAKAALDATDQPVSSESLTDRLFASARSLVSVRPVGNVEGTDTGAILARMEDKLKNGDVKGAGLEWDGLLEASKKASQDYKDALDRRVKADDLTRGLSERSATPAVKAG